MVLLCHTGTKNIMFDNTVINKYDFSFRVLSAIIGAHWEKVPMEAWRWRLCTQLLVGLRWIGQTLWHTQQYASARLSVKQRNIKTATIDTQPQSIWLILVIIHCWQNCSIEIVDFVYSIRLSSAVTEPHFLVQINSTISVLTSLPATKDY